MDLHKNYDFNSTEGRICLIFEVIYGDDEADFVKYLRELGIEVEGFRQFDEEYCPPFFRNQGEMTRFLFGETICTSSWYEGCSNPNVEQSTSHLKNLEDYDKVEINY